jgi:hypothetical protein
MRKDFDPTDYSMVVKKRGPPSNPCTSGAAFEPDKGATGF